MMTHLPRSRHQHPVVERPRHTEQRLALLTHAATGWLWVDGETVRTRLGGDTVLPGAYPVVAELLMNGCIEVRGDGLVDVTPLGIGMVTRWTRELFGGQP